MNTFCTIITPDYISYVKAQFQSLIRFNKDVQLYVLVCALDKSELEKEVYKKLPSGIHLHTIENVCSVGTGNEIFYKYFHEYKDKFRWSMKPAYLCFLFEIGAADKIIFIDWDIIFFNNYSFLFDNLDDNDILLTPHWGDMSPFRIDNKGRKVNTDFRYQFSPGIYNAGFVGANKKGKNILEWWAKVCLYSCKENDNGLHDDQAYLSLFHLQSDKVGILYNKGCHVAEWNKIECKRTMKGNEVLINEKYPIVFVHFTNMCIHSIVTGKDPLLEAHLEDYIQLYKEQNKLAFPCLAIEKIRARVALKHKFEKSFIGRLKYKIRIRTRILRFVEG